MVREIRLWIKMNTSLRGGDLCRALTVSRKQETNNNLLCQSPTFHWPIHPPLPPPSVVLLLYTHYTTPSFTPNWQPCQYICCLGAFSETTDAHLFYERTVSELMYTDKCQSFSGVFYWMPCSGVNAVSNQTCFPNGNYLCKIRDLQ